MASDSEGLRLGSYVHHLPSAKLKMASDSEGLRQLSCLEVPVDLLVENGFRFGRVTTNSTIM